jgi:hypothetical protein
VIRSYTGRSKIMPSRGHAKHRGGASTHDLSPHTAMRIFSHFATPCMIIAAHPCALPLWMEGAIRPLMKPVSWMVLLPVMKLAQRIRLVRQVNLSAGSDRVVATTATDRTRAMRSETAITSSPAAWDVPSIVAGAVRAVAHVDDRKDCHRLDCATSGDIDRSRGAPRCCSTLAGFAANNWPRLIQIKMAHAT